MSLRDSIQAIVREIPRGAVSTYGAVARRSGHPGAARQVGYALAALPDDTDIPWHRVVNAQGRISQRRAGTGPGALQRALLEDEGVVFEPSGRLDLERYGWTAGG